MTSEAALTERLHDFLTLEFTRGSVWTRMNARTNLFSRRRKREYIRSSVTPEQRLWEWDSFCTGHTQGTSPNSSQEGGMHPPTIIHNSCYGKADSFASRARTKYHSPVNGKWRSATEKIWWMCLHFTWISKRKLLILPPLPPPIYHKNLGSWSRKATVQTQQLTLQLQSFCIPNANKHHIRHTLELPCPASSALLQRGMGRYRTLPGPVQKGPSSPSRTLQQVSTKLRKKDNTKAEKGILGTGQIQGLASKQDTGSLLSDLDGKYPCLGRECKRLGQSGTGF